MNRIADDPEAARRLEERLAALVERLQRPIEERTNRMEMDDETKAELRALGYL